MELMEMKEIKSLLTEIKLRFPDAVKIVMQYHGSGDSFDSYGDCSVFDENGVDNFSTDDSEIILNMASPICDFAIDLKHVNFDGDGSEGEVRIDLITDTITIENFNIIFDTVLDFEESFTIPDEINEVNNQSQIPPDKISTW